MFKEYLHFQQTFVYEDVFQGRGEVSLTDGQLQKRIISLIKTPPENCIAVLKEFILHADSQTVIARGYYQQKEGIN